MDTINLRQCIKLIEQNLRAMLFFSLITMTLMYFIVSNSSANQYDQEKSSIELNETELFIFNQVAKYSKNLSQFDMYQIAKTINFESIQNDIDPILVMAVIKQESRWNINAKGRHGELGLMQILPNTARWISQKNNINYSGANDLLNPNLNIRLGIAYLSWLKKRLPNKEDYITAYNMGPKNLRQLKNKNIKPAIYYSKVQEHYLKYTDANEEISSALTSIDLIAKTPLQLLAQAHPDHQL